MPGGNPIKIKINRIIAARRWDVLGAILGVNDFSKYMPNVKESRILEKKHSKFKTQWAVEIDGIPIRWIEEESIDLANFTIHFHALEGDLAEFSGKWILKKHKLGTEVEVQVCVEVGVPVIEQFFGRVLEEKLVKNFTLVLEALNNRLVSERYLSFRQGKHEDIGGFAIIGHPYNLNNLIRYLQFLEPQFKAPSREFLTKIYELVPAYVMHDIQEFRSAAGVKVRGMVIVSTFVPEMFSVDPKMVLRKVIDACHVAESHQIGIAALGGFTSIVGERYWQEVEERVHIPLTTGNTFTVSLALDGIRKACDWMEIPLDGATACIIGGTGDIGSGCAKILAEEIKKIIVTGRSAEKVEEITAHLQKIGGAEVHGTLDNLSAVKEADIVIAAASVTSSIIGMDSFKPGAVVCDLAYPKNISRTAGPRDDILIFSGGLAEIPQEINPGFEIGLPSPKTLYGCFSEAILLDLDKRYESFSRGRGNITREKVGEIRAIGEKHGFHVAPFYRGDQALTRQDVEKIKETAKSKIAK